MNFDRQSARTRQAPAAAVNRLVDAATGAAVGRARPARSRLSPTQERIVQVCADAVQQLGLPNSVGQIYGVIYGSPRALAFADVVDSLGLSKGSVSQGLRFLRELGAIKPVEVPGDRRERFVPETELRRLIAGVLLTRVSRPLETGAEQLNAIERELAASDEPDREFLEQRLGSLRLWRRKALFVLPLLQRLLGPGKG